MVCTSFLISKLFLELKISLDLNYFWWCKIAISVFCRILVADTGYATGLLNTLATKHKDYVL
jgi:hypothetical protein